MSRHSILRAALACTSFFACSPAFSQPLTPLGVEFQVNLLTEDAQYAPSVAAAQNGDFVVVWASVVGDGPTSTGVLGRRFDSGGVPQGGELQVNTYTVGFQYRARVAADDSGEFVVAWTDYQSAPIRREVFARRFAVGGGPLAAPFQVNLTTSDNQNYPAIASDAVGDFVVAWQSNGQDGDLYGIFGRRFDQGGAPQGVEFQVASFTLGNQRHVDLAAEGDGDFIATWESLSQDGSTGGIFARRFSSAGAPQAVEFQVNTFTVGGQYTPAVAADADGDFVIAWASYLQDGSYVGVFARRFASSGTPLFFEFQINTYTPHVQFRPAVAAQSNGDFLVTWLSVFQDGDFTGVFARRFISSGAAQGTEFQINTYTPSYQFASTLASSPNGFVVAWESRGQESSSDGGIFARRFGTPGGAVLDVDANGAIEPLTDGLLVLRFAFGFTGTTLTNGAVALNCSRCAAVDIQTYLQGLGLVLDIDDNGAVEPLADGLLVLRFAFGFAGTTLVNGAVGTGCDTRCDVATILAYLQTLD